MKIPTQEQCFLLMCEMRMMDHIVVHSMQVCRVATFLAEHLDPAQNRLNHELIRAAALLHDITKTRSFKTEENHALTGGQLLAEQGYPEVGDLVRQHVRLDAYPDPVTLWEAEIINYADKRVLHDRIVGLDQRLDYIREKYGKLPEHQARIQWLWGKTLVIEKEIFSDLAIDPQDLNRLLNSEDRSKDFLAYQQVCNT
ncbi:Metal-dependent phosphohydrolase [Olavius sp. associated proteobacterium Delta 1]|nr:Metal-dependent phosphohydrolase [Olavius sp. associated proteobacterium Delta 1]